MNILVTNDDGINAIGIRKLANKLTQIGKVTVVAPDRERSAIGHAITMHHPLRVERFSDFGKNIDAWRINGTPSDCVKIAIESILMEKPDLVISGINNGPNLGTDVLYSGTVSAAIEGAIHDIPSIAMSVAGKRRNINYEGAIYYSCKIINIIMANKIPNNLIVNVNFPSVNYNDIKGIKITHLGIRKYINQFLKREDPLGRSYYWLAGELMEIENKNDSDVKAVECNYISMTPLQFDLTNYKLLEEMKSWKVE